MEKSIIDLSKSVNKQNSDIKKKTKILQLGPLDFEINHQNKPCKKKPQNQSSKLLLVRSIPRILDKGD